MKKRKKYLIIAFVSLPILYIIIGVTMVGIEEHIESNMYHIWVYNYTNDAIEIIINNKYVVNVEGKTLLEHKAMKNEVFNSDEMFNGDEREYNYYSYLIKSNGNIILNKEMNVFGSFSAGGGLVTAILINKIDENNYDIIFERYEMRGWLYWLDWLELKKVSESRWWMDFFNSDGLDQ